MLAPHSFDENLSVIVHPDLQVPHGFFGRAGGVSTGPFTSLNGGWLGDIEAHVQENRRRALSFLNAKQAFFARQNHGCHVLTVPEDPMDQCADAMVTKVRGHTLGVLTADCAPVLFYDAAGIIGIAHAGWRGAVSGVLENTVQAMRKLGARTPIAIIGPTISVSAYEVGLDFSERIASCSSFDVNVFFHKTADRLFFNLPSYIQYRLKNQVSHVYDVQCNTFGEQFFSRRYALAHAQDQYGRSMSFISLP